MIPRVAVIDYGAGNLRSIRRALEAAGAEVAITDDPATIAAADAIVLPGVGHAGASMRRLAELGLLPMIDQAVADGRPFLGICLGMQLLFGHQEEGDAQGLGVLAGRVRSLRGAVKVPQIGWNRVTPTGAGPLGTPEQAHDYYFVHSYIVESDNPGDVAAVTEYGERFPSVVIHDNVWGTQFHPEKSGPAGLALIRTWVEQIAARAATARPREAVGA